MNTTTKQTSRLRLTAIAVGGLFLTGSVMAQAVRQDTPEAQGTTNVPVTVGVSTTPPPISDDIIMMSPFQVDATKDKGYFAENTLAGSRMRTNIADLGAAISIVTKQQMEDTASLDINDIFRYEIGTEGATTYTPTGMTHRNDGVADAISGNTFGNNFGGTATNATANRVRGLGAPSFALNYYEAIARIPFDSYNAASVEINRGPNSLLFGMGNPSGIVNMSMAQALINKRSAQVQIRIDDRGSNRASFNFNQPLIKDKLAIYGALLYNDQQYERKPSYDITRRQYGAITYTPFKRTKITASIEGYNNDNRRPNSLTPKDGVTEWLKAGQPYYDALSSKIISNATGETLSVLALSIDSPHAQAVLDFLRDSKGIQYSQLTQRKSSTSDPNKVTDLWYNGTSIFGTAAITTENFPLYVKGIGFQTGRSAPQIVNGNILNWVHGSFRPNTAWNASGQQLYQFRTSYDVNANSTLERDGPYLYDNSVWATMYGRSWTESTLYSQTQAATGIATSQYPGVTDSAIYDWRNVNTLSMNYGTQRNTNYNIELEQEIIPNLLHFSGGWFRQDFDAMQSYTVAQQYATTLVVDTNKYLPDGSDNPLFGCPYVFDIQPDRYLDSTTVDHLRAMLAFTPDFTKNRGWTKWLGRHRILGMASYKDQVSTTVRQRLSHYNGSQYQENNYMQYQNTATDSWRIATDTSVRRQFYLSDSGLKANQGTGGGAYNGDVVNSTILTYDYATGQWVQQPMTMIWADYNANTARAAHMLTSYAAAWNGYLWNDRIITTIGVRRDISRTRGTTTAAVNGQPAMNDGDLYDNGFLQTGKFFDRWGNWSRLAGTTTTMGAVIKPFLHWEYITKRSSSSLLWEFIENLGFSYNKSDNFNAPTTTGVDFFRNTLPKPVGNGKDYGVQFTLFKNKLFARVNWFEATNENSPETPTVMLRLNDHIDSTAYRSWLSFIYMLNDGVDPITDQEWRTKARTYVEGDSIAEPAKVTAMQAWVAEKWGLGDWNYYNSGNMGGTIRGTSTQKAKGTEVTVQYNPVPNWTLKLTASKTETSTSDLLKEYDAWLAIRKAQWDGANAGDLLTPGAKAKYYIEPSIELTEQGGYTLAADNTRIRMSDFWSGVGYYDTRGNRVAFTYNNSDPGMRNSEAYYKSVLLPMELEAKAKAGRIVDGQRKYNASMVTNYNFTRGTLKGWGIGGAQRYASKSVIGYHGKASGNNKITVVENGQNVVKDLLDIPDVNRPIYDSAEWYTDLWVSYTCKIFNDKVRMKLQLNVADVFQDGELKPVAVGYDGKPYAYRIMDPRTFILTASFDF